MTGIYHPPGCLCEGCDRYAPCMSTMCPYRMIITTDHTTVACATEEAT